MSEKRQCGYVAIVGRPNVGKSTLLNRIVGQKISITARKPQTTRHKIIGIKTTEKTQTVYVDTPGLYKGHKKALTTYMQKEIDNALFDVDIIVFVIEALKWRDQDEAVVKKIAGQSNPVILVINKVDTVKDKDELLPFMEKVASQLQFAAIVPVSAKGGNNVEDLEGTIANFLPESPFYYYPEQVTDRSERFLAAEIIREKLTRLLGHELPHDLTVVIEHFSRKDKITHVSAVIYVEKRGQKIIIVGKKGEKLKEVGKKARLDIQKMLGNKVFLQLWVKVKRGWSSDEKVLGDLGYKTQE